MAILDRSSGTFVSATNVSVTRSTGSYGTGTVIVVVIFGNTVFNTPGGWTQRTSNVNTLGLYSYDKAGAGEASISFTATAAGQGTWFAWELSPGSVWDTGQATETAGGILTFDTPSITPAAGGRHILAVAGANRSGAAGSVSSWSGGFTEWADAQGTTAGDGTFAAAADLNVTADGTTAYTTTATFNTTVSPRGGFTLAYVNAVQSSWTYGYDVRIGG